jgi:hypothetical protein
VLPHSLHDARDDFERWIVFCLISFSVLSVFSVAPMMAGERTPRWTPSKLRYGVGGIGTCRIAGGSLR